MYVPRDGVIQTTEVPHIAKQHGGIAFDIETIRDPTIDPGDLPEPEVSYGNIVDPAKKQAKLDDAKAKLRSKLALDPYYGRILAIALAFRPTTITDEKPVFATDKACIRVAMLGTMPTLLVYDDPAVTNIDQATTSAELDALERRLLIWFWDEIADAQHGTVSFNGIQFDIPYLIKRSLLLNVISITSLLHPAHVTISGKDDHTDVMSVLQYSDVGRGRSYPVSYARGLSFYAKRLLGRELYWDQRGNVDKSELLTVASCDSGHQDVINGVADDALATLELSEMLAGSSLC